MSDISHWIAVIVLLLVVAGGMVLAWPYRKNRRAGLHADLDGPGSAIPAISDHDHHHASGDGISGTD